MNKAQKWGYIITSPFTGMRNIKIPETYPKYFTREEFQQKWQDVDLGRRVVTIQCPPLS
jgi:hypothetical protein